MKLFAIKAHGNYGAGLAIVRADIEAQAREIAAQIRGDTSWNMRWGKPDDVEEIPDDGESGIVYLFETGE